MKKTLFIFLISILILSTLTACGGASAVPGDSTNGIHQDAREVEADVQMERLGQFGWGDFVYYRDAVTDVIYVRYRNAGGLTVMLDPETGLPLTYARYIEIYENTTATAD